MSERALAGFLVTVALSALPASAQTGGEVPVNTMSTSAAETRNKSLVEASFTAWRYGTGSPFDLLADDASWTIVGQSDASRTYPNREAFMREVIRPFNARMREPLKPRIRNIYADGETVIVFFDAGGAASDGVRYDNTYAWFLEFRDDRIVRAHAFFDSIAFNELWRRVRPTPAKEKGG
jgi:ketosteroid isomerase-like protein